MGLFTVGLSARPVVWLRMTFDNPEYVGMAYLK